MKAVCAGNCTVAKRSPARFARIIDMRFGKSRREGRDPNLKSFPRGFVVVFAVRMLVVELLPNDVVALCQTRQFFISPPSSFHLHLLSLL